MGGPKRRVWRRVHLGIDEETQEIRAVEITSSDVGDAPMLPEPLALIPAGQDIASVTADGVYDTRKCHGAIAEHSAHAVIPLRKNAKLWKTLPRLVSLRATRRCGRRNTSAMRSGIPSRPHPADAPAGQCMARDCDRQVAEFQVRVAVLNG